MKNGIFFIFCLVFNLLAEKNNVITKNDTANWYDEVTTGIVFLFRFESKNIFFEDKIDTSSVIEPHGTGFLVWNYSGGNPILITNKHLLDGQNNLVVIFRSSANDSAIIRVLVLKDNNNNPIWKSHPNPNVDIAGMVFAPKSFKPITISLKSYPYSMFKTKGQYKIADKIYFFGYPLGLREPVTYKPLCKSGIISAIGDKDSPFLIDAFAAPGNSGSPVFWDPILHVSADTLTLGFIGILSAGFPTGGLAVVYPADQVKNVVDLFK